MKAVSWVFGLGLFAAVAGYFFWRVSKDENPDKVYEEWKSATPQTAEANAPRVEAPKSAGTIVLRDGVRPDAPGRVSAAVEEVIRPEKGYRRADVWEAQKALRKLDAESLTADEKKALRWFLFEPTANETIRNDAANVLATAKDAELPGALAVQMRNLKQTALWRNYCVQHLSVYYERAESKPEILEELFYAAEKDPDDTVRDCGLLQLARLAEVKDWQTGDKALFVRVAALAKKFLEPERTEVEWISGIRAAGRLGLAEECGKLLAFLKTDKPGVRLAAMVELGGLYGQADEPTKAQIKDALQAATKSNDRMLREVAERALKELQK
jgi:hypothetical protein